MINQHKPSEMAVAPWISQWLHLAVSGCTSIFIHYFGTLFYTILGNFEIVEKFDTFFGTFMATLFWDTLFTCIFAQVSNTIVMQPIHGADKHDILLIARL